MLGGISEGACDAGKIGADAGALGGGATNDAGALGTGVEAGAADARARAAAGALAGDCVGASGASGCTGAGAIELESACAVGIVSGGCGAETVGALLAGTAGAPEAGDTPGVGNGAEVGGAPGMDCDTPKVALGVCAASAVAGATV